MADFRLFIDGAFRDAASGETFQTLDPSTGEAVATVARAGREDARAAIAAAKASFQDRRWAGRSGAERGAVLREASRGIAEQAADLAELERRDSGSTLTKAMAADVGGAIQWFKAMGDLAATLDQPEPLPRSTFPMPSSNWLHREPVGVCAAITPWNFPLQMAAWKLSMALAAGNSVVLKPAEETPCTALRLAEILHEAGVPDGVVNVIPGPGPGPGEELAGHPDLDKVSFTGSTSVGREIMRMAAGTLKKVTLELGGKSAQVVLDDADLDLAVDGALYAVFLHSGQACTAGSRLLLPDSLYEPFMERLLERVAAIRVGPTADPTTTMGPLVSQKQLDTVLGYIDIGQKEGATLAAGGARLSDGEPAQGFFVQPTVFTDVTPDMAIAQEEIFGPVLSVLRYRDEDEAVAIANGTIYGLAAGVWGSQARALAMADRLRAGTVWVNEWHLLSPQFPFGGYKQSGVGREHGLLGLHEWTEVKHVHAAMDTRRKAHRWFDIVTPRS